ncbi:MAG: D-arabinono-1,4-lactone oxidase [bacterium]|nr:D-arabinono-1,4-lactone oxidase [bacterium]
MTHIWRNWSRSVSCEPSAFYAPTSQDDLIRLVKSAGRDGKKIRVAGSGHSFTPLVASNDILISLQNYGGLLNVDKVNQTATLKAGTTIKQAGELLFEHGLMQENLGDINVQSLAGAISTGTHGTGTGLGTIATQVIGMTLITGDGEVITCSETENSDIFKAAQISLGTLGMISTLTLRLNRSYILRGEIRKSALDKTLSDLDTLKAQNRHFEFYALPYSDKTQTRCFNIVTDAPKKDGIGRWMNEIVLENGVLWMLSAFNRAFPSNSARIAKLIGAAVSDADYVNYAHRAFASRRLVKFQEMEYNIPAEHFTAALTEILDTIRKDKHQVHFPIECRFVKGDDIPLSPAYGRDSAYIAVHMFNGMDYRRYFDAIEAIFARYGGRPHWGKMHTRNADDLAPLYPRWDFFQGVRNITDPARVFTTPYIGRLLGA